jgi:hypothetical protein
MLVISSSAAHEAARLAHQCTRVRPFRPSPATVALVTSIDGAVLVDLDGLCHAIGVILDGVASPRCTPARGARFNSAVRYAYGRDDCMVVVKSEDGMVDLLPALRPQIRHADLESNLAALRRLAAAEFVECKEYHAVLEWFERHRFYLKEAHCRELNLLKPAVEDLLDPSVTRLIFPDFTPDPEMNDSYYVQEN